VWQAVAEGLWAIGGSTASGLRRNRPPKIQSILILTVAELLPRSKPPTYQSAIADPVMTTNPEIVQFINTAPERIELSAP
jgi:hypothetical protein